MTADEKAKLVQRYQRSCASAAFAAKNPVLCGRLEASTNAARLALLRSWRRTDATTTA